MTTPLERFLALVKHRRTGPDHGVFHVPTRKDRHPSGTWRELPDGRLLIWDHGGGSIEEILGAIGLELADLFPKEPEFQSRPERRPFNPADVLRAIAFEALVVLAVAGRLSQGEALPQGDRDRLTLAVSRLQAATRGAGL